LWSTTTACTDGAIGGSVPPRWLECTEKYCSDVRPSSGGSEPVRKLVLTS
jgi:hypothetical protein